MKKKAAELLGRFFATIAPQPTEKSVSTVMEHSFKLGDQVVSKGRFGDAGKICDLMGGNFIKIKKSLDGTLSPYIHYSQLRLHPSFKHKDFIEPGDMVRIKSTFYTLTTMKDEIGLIGKVIKGTSLFTVVILSNQYPNHVYNGLGRNDLELLKPGYTEPEEENEDYMIREKGTKALYLECPRPYHQYETQICEVVSYDHTDHTYDVEFSDGMQIFALDPVYLDFNYVKVEEKPTIPLLEWDNLTQEERAAFVKKIIESMYMDKTLCGKINELIS